MRRETQNVLLILIGLALAKLAWTGDYLNYVKPSALPWLIGGAGAIVLLAAASITRDFGKREPVPVEVGDCCDDDNAPGDRDEHAGHTHGGRSAWFLLLPVVAVLFIAPGALGAESVVGSDGNTLIDPAAAESGFAPLPSGDVVPVALSEFQARAAWDEKKSLDGRSVQLTGFVVHDKAKTYLARMVIGCCAADAYPVKVSLGGDAADEVASFADDKWVKVTGQYVAGSATADTRYVPELTVEAVELTKRPRNPYE